MAMRWLALPLSALCLLPACSSRPGLVLHQYGVMREVMREGRSEARTPLARFAGPGTVAVGALAGLHGEFVIDDGVAWVAVDTPEAVAGAPDAKATLLTAAVVPAWREATLAAVGDLGGLEAAIEQAHGAPIADREVVPFTLVGVGSVQLHVARGGCPHDANLPAASAPARWSGDQVPLRLVGFFVKGREGELTHMGTSLHVHVLATGADGKRRTGHVEQVALAAGARLQLPTR